MGGLSPGDQIQVILVSMLTLIGFGFLIAGLIRLKYFHDRVWGCIFLMTAMLMVIPGALAGLNW